MYVIMNCLAIKWSQGVWRPQINGKRCVQISDYERQSPNKVGSWGSRPFGKTVIVKTSLPDFLPRDLLHQFDECRDCQ